MSENLYLKLPWSHETDISETISVVGRAAGRSEMAELLGRA